MKGLIALLCLGLVFGCSSPAPTPVGQMAVTIQGDVHHPGRYFLPQGASLAEALQRAGSFTDFAILRDIRIAHRDGAVVHCNFRKDGNDFKMADGDEVFVDSMKGAF